MMDQEWLTTLAEFHSPGGRAVSFYFSEYKPDNFAHQAAVISARETARELLRSGNDVLALRPLVQKIEQRGEAFRTGRMSGLAIFASTDGDLWQELELPFQVRPRALMGESFSIAPLLSLAVPREKTLVLLLDRSVTRLLAFDGDDLVERTNEFGEERISVRETGASRKKSDERSKDDDAFHHMRHVGERILRMIESGEAEAIFVGCRAELYPEIKAAFPDLVVARFAGQFPCDPGLASREQVGAIVRPLRDERARKKLDELLEAIAAGVARGARGATGPQAVMEALELGELQEVVVGQHEPVPATVCTSCSHVDLGQSGACSLCANPVRRFADLEEVLARRALKGSFLLHRAARDRTIGGDGFMALLRFRADKNTNMSQQVA